MTQFIHELDLMCLVFGKPTSVSATLDTLVLPLDSEDTFAATIRFDGGAIVACNSLVGADRSDVSFEIVGTTKLFRQTSAEEGGAKRTSKIDLVKKGFGRIQERLFRKKTGPPPTPGAPRGGGTHRPYFEAVLSALDRGKPLPIPPEEARGAVELATAIYTSGLSGQTVRLPLNGSSQYYAGVTTDAYRARSNG
jgi:predicted dehydrogenase